MAQNMLSKVKFLNQGFDLTRKNGFSKMFDWFSNFQINKIILEF